MNPLPLEVKEHGHWAHEQLNSLYNGGRREGGLACMYFSRWDGVMACRPLKKSQRPLTRLSCSCERAASLALTSVSVSCKAEINQLRDQRRSSEISAGYAKANGRSIGRPDAGRQGHLHV
jgi:hypothetical protein